MYGLHVLQARNLVSTGAIDQFIGIQILNITIILAILILYYGMLLESL